jgi:peptidoglycan/xylan/chitin deacetylase (PgdA/CDA1 family)
MMRVNLRKLLSFTGLVWGRWRMLGLNLYCFNYHRLGNPEDCQFDRGVFSCGQGEFREHLGLIKRRFEVIGLERIPWLLNHRPIGRRPYALITFDDGYFDNYALALPMLREFDMTATFFIPTAFIGSRRIPWWDEIAWTLRHASVRQLRLRGVNEVFSLEPDAVERTTIRILDRVATRSDIPMGEQVDEMREACRPREPMNSVNLFMDWPQVRALRAAGMDIGAHTHTHPVLSHLDDAAQKQELETSRGILEQELREMVHAVAYPGGQQFSYTRRTCRLAQSVGFQLGFNFLGRPNRLPIADPLDIGRMDASGGDGRHFQARVCFPAL